MEDEQTAVQSLVYLRLRTMMVECAVRDDAIGSRNGLSCSAGLGNGQ